jgi:hypothetical protein
MPAPTLDMRHYPGAVGFDPQPGQRCTFTIGSDRYPVTVVKRHLLSVTTSDDTARQIGDYYGNQRWISVSNPNGRIRHFTKRKDGRWLLVGQKYGYLSAGSHPYRDPSF